MSLPISNATSNLGINIKSVAINMETYIPLNQSLEIDISTNNTCTSKFYRNNGSTIYRNESLFFTIPASIHNVKGIYNLKVNCSDGSYYQSEYLVNEKGIPPATDLLIIFIYILFIFSLFGSVYTFLTGIVHFLDKDVQVLNVILSWSFFFLIIVSIYLSKVYIIDNFIEGAYIEFIAVAFASNFLFPLISYTQSILRKSLEMQQHSLDDLDNGEKK